MASTGFRLRTLLYVIVYCGMVFEAMRNCTDVWAVVHASIGYYALVVSIIGAIYAGDRARAFFVGYAIVGWLRVGFMFVELPIQYRRSLRQEARIEIR